MTDSLPIVIMSIEAVSLMITSDCASIVRQKKEAYLMTDKGQSSTFFTSSHSWCYFIMMYRDFKYLGGIWTTPRYSIAFGGKMLQGK